MCAPTTPARRCWASPAGGPPRPRAVAGVTGALDQVRAHRAGQTVLVVTSGGPISTAVSHVLDTPPETTIELNLRIRTTSGAECAVTPKRHMLVAYNGISHLEAPEYADWVTYA